MSTLIKGVGRDYAAKFVQQGLLELMKLVLKVCQQQLLQGTTKLFSWFMSVIIRNKFQGGYMDKYGTRVW